MERVPVLLWQVGFHVKKGILPLLDLGADLLNESKLLRTRSGLAPARTTDRDIPVHVFIFLFKGKQCYHKARAVKTHKSVTLCMSLLYSCCIIWLTMILFHCLVYATVGDFNQLIYKSAALFRHEVFQDITPHTDDD